MRRDAVPQLRDGVRCRLLMLDSTAVGFTLCREGSPRFEDLLCAGGLGQRGLADADSGAASSKNH